jgi:hypothetical protein
VGLAALLLALVVFALLRWQPPLIVISALGLLPFFLTYLHESDVSDDVPVRTLLITAVLGVGLGVGWALLTGTIVARSHGFAPGAGMASERVLRAGLAVPLGGAILMLVPVVLVRISRPAIRESLDGFVIGSLATICFTAAATLTRLAPQLGTGLVARERPIGGLLVEAGIRGVAMPLTAAAVGGMVGAALWFRRPSDTSHRHRWHALAALLPGFVVLIVFAAMGLIDGAQLPQSLQLGLYMAITVVALLALRVVLHMALLYEEHDHGSGAPLPCPNCDHVTPDTAFCPNCGVARNASSRSSRNARRLAYPVHTDRTPEGP